MQMGEERAWELLAESDPASICTRAQVDFDHSNALYILKSFGQSICISVQDRDICANSPMGEHLVNGLSHISRLTILWYLIQAKELPLSGRMVRPQELPGGEIYLKGTHRLPLEKIVREFADDLKGFLRRGRRLESQQLNQGELSLQLFPFPRVPVVITIWAGDEEFPPRCILLFDSTCTVHLPADIIWSTALMTVEIMLC